MSATSSYARKQQLDIVRYYSTSERPISIYYTIQPQPAGLRDAIFRALPLIAPDELAVVGLPDTIWYPAVALRSLAGHPFSFLPFPADQPQLFDSVATDASSVAAGLVDLESISTQEIVTDLSRPACRKFPV